MKTKTVLLRRTRCEAFLRNEQGPTRSLSRGTGRFDVIMTAATLLLVVGMYLYFSLWLKG